jgi:hypothetical protein
MPERKLDRVAITTIKEQIEYTANRFLLDDVKFYNF